MLGSDSWYVHNLHTQNTLHLWPKAHGSIILHPGTKAECCTNTFPALSKKCQWERNCHDVIYVTASHAFPVRSSKGGGCEQKTNHWNCALCSVILYCTVLTGGQSALCRITMITIKSNHWCSNLPVCCLEYMCVCVCVRERERERLHITKLMCWSKYIRKMVK